MLLLERLKDPNENPYVKDTAAWTIARVCEFVPRVITPTNLNDILLHFFNALEQVWPCERRSRTPRDLLRHSC